MGRLIDADAVKKKYPLMENDFGMTFNEGIHKVIDSMPTVEAIPKTDVVAILDKIKAEIKDYFSITCDGNCDNCNRVVKNPCGESVDGAWVLHIIDKYKAESEE